LRDIAVLKATGAPNRVLVGSLVAQAMALSLASALLAIPLALLMKPGMDFDVLLGPTDYLTLAVVAVVIGGLASLAGLRRALTVDPAMAFAS
jgi:putative ABC transport system permease protein